MQDTTATFRTQLVEELPALKRYARALTRRTDRADDLVQDCIERALRRADLYRPDSNLRAWLFTMMRNLAASSARYDKVRLDHAQRILDSGALVEAPRQTQLIELKETLRLLGGLNAGEREAIRLLGIQEMSHEQAATVSGQLVGTMKSRLSRGRARLRQISGDLAA